MTQNTIMRDKLLALFATQQIKQVRVVRKAPEVIAVKKFEQQDGKYVGNLGNNVDKRS